MGFILIFFVWLVLGAIGSAIMKSKGRSSGAGFALGFFFGVIGLIIAACLKPGVNVRPRPAGPAVEKSPAPATVPTIDPRIARYGGAI